MMRLNEICETLDKHLKVETAEPWDNVGLLVGDKNKSINKVLIALELTRESLEFALENSFDMIITHHPAIFQPVKKFVKSLDEYNLLYELIRSGLALYSCHTNFDILEDTMDSYLAKKVGAKSINTIDDCNYGICFDIERITAESLANLIVDKLEISDVRLIGNKDKIVEKVVMISGSASDMYDEAKKVNADMFITGDVKYHTAQDYLNDNSMVVLDIGHYGSEKCFAKVFIEKFGYLLEDVMVEEYTRSQDPFIVIGGR